MHEAMAALSARAGGRAENLDALRVSEDVAEILDGHAARAMASRLRAADAEVVALRDRLAALEARGPACLPAPPAAAAAVTATRACYL